MCLGPRGAGSGLPAVRPLADGVQLSDLLLLSESTSCLSHEHIKFSLNTEHDHQDVTKHGWTKHRPPGLKSEANAKVHHQIQNKDRIAKG